MSLGSTLEEITRAALDRHRSVREVSGCACPTEERRRSLQGEILSCWAHRRPELLRRCLRLLGGHRADAEDALTRTLITLVVDLLKAHPPLAAAVAELGGTADSSRWKDWLAKILTTIFLPDPPPAFL